MVSLVIEQQQAYLQENTELRERMLLKVRGSRFVYLVIDDATTCRPDIFTTTINDNNDDGDAMLYSRI